MPRNPHCHRCILHQGVNSVCIFGTGPKPSDIMLLGEAPGGDEDNLGTPFVGRAGELLTTLLNLADIPRNTVYISNAIKCRPPGNRDPTNAELSACFSYLAEEINTVQPKVILCMGRIALQIMTGVSSIKASRGKPIPAARYVRVGDAKILATYHPAASFYRSDTVDGDKGIRDAILDDLRMASVLAGRTVSNLPKHERVLILPDEPYQNLKDALSRLSNATEIAVDCEWTAGKTDDDNNIRWPWTPDAELYSISLTGRLDERTLLSVAIAWPATDKPSKAQRLLQSFLSRRRLVFHNAMSDLIWLTSVGFRLKARDDSQFLGYLLNEEQNLSLDQLGPLLAGIPPGWKIGPWFRRPNNNLGWKELLEYNSDDTYATLLLIEAERSLIRKRSKEEQRNLARAYFKLLIPALPPFIEMAIRGIAIDIEALKAKIIEIRLHEKEQLAEAARLLGMRNDHVSKLINSPLQLKAFLNHHYYLDIEDTEADTLEPFGDDYPVIGVIASIKHDRKLLSTYLEPWLEMVERQGDGRLHFVYRLDRTRTGRTTARSELGGSIQLAPREDWLRQLFIARPGYKLLAADESQIELRMIAWLAPERTMTRLFNEDADLHKATAAFVKSKRTENLTMREFWSRREELMQTVTKQDRDRAKGVNFGFDFGMQAPKFVRYARKSYKAIFTQEEAEEARDGYFELYSDLQEWHERSEKEMQSGKPIVMPFGRYRRSATDTTQYINTPIQTTANDISIFATGNIYTELEEEFEDRWQTNEIGFVGFIHDAIMLEVRDDWTEYTSEVVKRNMEHPPVESIGVPPIPIPLKADVELYQAWTKKLLTS